MEHLKSLKILYIFFVLYFDEQSFHSIVKIHPLPSIFLVASLLSIDLYPQCHRFFACRPLDGRPIVSDDLSLNGLAQGILMDHGLKLCNEKGAMAM